MALVNLGRCYEEAGDLVQAEPLLREGLDATRQVLGPHHARTAGAYGSLARLYARMDDLERAELFALRGQRIPPGERRAIPGIRRRS